MNFQSLKNLILKQFKKLKITSLISRIEVGYRDNSSTIKIYYKLIDDSILN